ncbi:hypothetical protein NH26_20120 [Flammeovirga pacifica]|uniref:Endonuclease I n=2 Tax=Flammeovirga pacifica TaxID=915059 RepID=A0A1S1YSB9_FLAPC|nr:hypothetical protein NH26_20120 [Flammeovirga pacifica]
MFSILTVGFYSCDKNDTIVADDNTDHDSTMVAKLEEKFFGTKYREVEISGWTHVKVEGRGGFQYNSHWTSDSYANITVFKAGEERKTWLISPKLNVTRAEDKTISFDSRQEFDKGVLFKVFVSADYNGEFAPEQYTWTELDVTLSKDGSSDYGSWVNTGKIDLSEYGNVSVGFYFEGDERDPQREGGYSIDNFKFNEDGTDYETGPEEEDEYYKSAEGKEGYELKSTLSSITKRGHEWISYGDLWVLYKTSDDKYQRSEIIWDMYSDIPDPNDPTVPDGAQPGEYEYAMSTDQCGNSGSGEGFCYNREHVVPQSYFEKAMPMVSDAHHIVPVDAYVNTMRSNHPYGIVETATWTSINKSKRGNGTTASGYTGTVFEPIDEYKGDFARMYLYMAVRYEDEIGSWVQNSTQAAAILDGSKDKVFKDWYLKIMLDWHNSDPVSDKEIDRNEQVYLFQGNRNPFIDHPEFANEIWGDVQ